MITTLTLIRYRGFRNKVWAFVMMRSAHAMVTEAEGLDFYRLMGAGAGTGFHPWPDFSAYAFLGVWASEEQADAFLRGSRLFAEYREHCSEMWTVYLKTLRSHGQWAGTEPFVPSVGPVAGSLIGVITRATIARKRLLRFWRHVPATHAPLQDQDGLLVRVGIGEWPVTQMATFSIWREEESLRAYAYGHPDHLEAIRLTRELNWYSEELFARFRPYRSEGSWNGENPLEGLL